MKKMWGGDHPVGSDSEGRPRRVGGRPHSLLSAHPVDRTHPWVYVEVDR